MPTDVIMPALGMAQETGKVVAWKKHAGDKVAKGEPLLEVETDKAVVEVESPASGTLSSVSAEAGAEVPIGTVIALILSPNEGDVSAASSLAGEAGLARTAQPAGDEVTSPLAGEVGRMPGGGELVHSSPGGEPTP